VSIAERRTREAFGNRLREIRLDAGLSGRQLADLTGFHFTKVSRVEHGGQSLSDADIRLWAASCGVDAQVPDLIAQMRTVDRLYREWRRQARTGLRRLQNDLVPLYERMRLLRAHEHWSIPGLLQTVAYSTASMVYWQQLLSLPDDTIEATAARIERQRILREGDHRFVFLLAEQVLYTIVGTPETMLDQLDHLTEAMDLPRVSVGIIPATAGMGAHTQTAFWIYDDSLVQVETLTAGLDITRPEEIELYVTVFEQMKRTAMFGRNAKALIARARHELLQQSATS
jgi:transcriptional regulator with XRE-family HTH domain